ncbi:MAG: adenine phosphoribosyltransferase [Bacteroidetes bacterium]|jgi:adenine phosphoribosyltransferase|nr:adenine phosphoribosyltransferase [Bacteroidota bacterium]
MNESKIIEELKASIRNIPDFPKPGIQFKDITTLLQNPVYLQTLIDLLVKKYQNLGITKVCCIESRGFFIGSILAYKLNAGIVPIRKPGKLPAETISKSFTLEYGEDSLEIHTDALTKDDVVLMHDDLLATGGTAEAAQNLALDLRIAELYMNFIIELDFLKGRDKLNKNYDIHTLIHF